MPNSTKRTGELLIFSEAILWSLFPVVTKLSYGTLGPLFTASLATIISSIFFLCVLLGRGTWREFTRAYPWKETIIGSAFIGFVFYAFFFTGLTLTTAGNGAIASQMEIFFSFLILTVLSRHETLVASQVIGAVCMVVGAILILLPQASGWHIGDALIIIGTAFPPLGNKYMQAARRKASAESVLFLRTLVSFPLLLTLGFFTEAIPSVSAIESSIVPLLFSGIVLLGISKIMWVEGTIRLPITTCISLASISPAFTLLFAFLFLGEHVTALQIASLLPITFGILLLTRKKA